MRVRLPDFLCRKAGHQVGDGAHKRGNEQISPNHDRLHEASPSNDVPDERQDQVKAGDGPSKAQAPVHVHRIPAIH